MSERENENKIMKSHIAIGMCCNFSLQRVLYAHLKMAQRTRLSLSITCGYMSHFLLAFFWSALCFSLINCKDFANGILQIEPRYIGSMCVHYTDQSGYSMAVIYRRWKSCRNCIYEKCAIFSRSFSCTLFSFDMKCKSLRHDE